MKLCNFASLDPALKLRGIRGLEGASALDRSTWEEFHRDLNTAVPASEGALCALFGVDEAHRLEVLPREGIRVRPRHPSGPTEVAASVKVRRGQDYFREAVLNNFGGRCGITQLAVRELLVASHILPWSDHPQERLNVRNGICLSRLHDAAFDCHLISFDENLRLVLSPRLKQAATPGGGGELWGVCGRGTESAGGRGSAGSRVPGEASGRGSTGKTRIARICTNRRVALSGSVIR